MKSFQQFNEDAPGSVVGEVEKTETGEIDITSPEVLKRVNAFVGSIADREYLIPEGAIHQLKGFLERIGLSFDTPTLPEGNGNISLPLKQYGGRYGKDTNTPYDEVINDDGISHRKEGGLSLDLNIEELQNNSWKVYAKIV